MAVYQALTVALGLASLFVTAILGIISIVIMLSNNKEMIRFICHSQWR